MANLVLFTASTSHAAATNTKSALEDRGHTVTSVADNNGGGFGSGILATDVSGYDAMVAVRTTGETGGTTALRLREKVNAGKPLAIGMIDTGAAASSSVVVNPTRMDLMGSARAVANGGSLGQNINITDVSHDITSIFGSTGNQSVMVGSNFQGSVNGSFSHVGTKLGEGPAGEATAGETSLFAVERNTLDLDGTPAAVGARVVVWGNLYGGQTAYTADGKDLLDSIIDWLIQPVGLGLVVGFMTLR